MLAFEKAVLEVIHLLVQGVSHFSFGVEIDLYQRVGEVMALGIGFEVVQLNYQIIHLADHQWLDILELLEIGLGEVELVETRI